MRRWTWRSALFAAVALAPLAGCSTNAATGKSSLMFLSREDEITLGAEAAPQIWSGRAPGVKATSRRASLNVGRIASSRAVNRVPNSVSVRVRGVQKDLGAMPLDRFVEELKREIEERGATPRVGVGAG